MSRELTKWNTEKCIDELKRQYEKHGILNATTIHDIKGGMAKYIESNHGSLSAFCSNNGIEYLFRSGKNNWTEEKAIKTLQNLFEKIGAMSTSELQTENSGLEKYLRDKKGGVRPFCEKNNLSHVLKKPKKNNWTTEKAITVIKDTYEKYKEPVGNKLLSKAGYGGLYQWASKEYKNYKDFIISNGLTDYTSYQNNWTDAQCFRLIKDEFITNKGAINPEFIKQNYKGAHAYIYHAHGSFENFLNTYDLQDYVEISNTIYTDEIVQRKIKEAYTLYGEKVYVTWLNENGFGGAGIYLTRLGEGSFLEGAKKLGLEEYVMSKYTDWTDELVLKKINDILQEKGEAIISSDFDKYKLTGMRDWIKKKHGGLQEFFEKYEMESQFANMGHVGEELWWYGMQFEKLAKEAIELFHKNVAYNKKVGNVRPDFILEDGLWIDTKLSSFAFHHDETVKKYTARDECTQLWLLYLRGPEITHARPDVHLISIKEWYDDLKLFGREDLVNQFDELRRKVYEKEKINRRKTSE